MAIPSIAGRNLCKGHGPRKRSMFNSRSMRATQLISKTDQSARYDQILKCHFCLGYKQAPREIARSASSKGYPRLIIHIK